MAEKAVEIWRGDRVESVVRADVAVVDSVGNVRYWFGNPYRETYWRSCAKPFQAMPLVESGAAARFSFTSQEIALVSGSHSGEERHVDMVAGLLRRIGLSVENLTCGTDWPESRSAREALLRGGLTSSALHNRCSGKHAGMLALAVALETDVAGYGAPTHPVQKTIAETVALMSGISRMRLATAPDGCGVPTFYLSLVRMAWAYALLVDPRGLSDSTAAAALMVSEAMRQHPDVVSGSGRLELRLAEASQGRLVLKSGAEGLFCVGIPDKGLGVAIKIEDGSNRAMGSVLSATLAESGVFDDAAVSSLRDVIIRDIPNCSGEVVGQMRPVLRLHAGRLR